MPTSEDFKAELMQMLYEATREGKDYADIVPMNFASAFLNIKVEITG